MGRGYLASDDATYADFVQWTDSSETVSGTIQEDTLGGTAPSEAASTTTDPVTGQITGTNVSLAFGLSNQMFGTYSGGVLRLNIPQQDGTLALATFTSASPEAFNKAVQALQLRVYNDNQTAIVQQEVQSQDAAIDRASSTVNQDLSTLTSDQSSITSAMASLPNDLAQEKSDLATSASDEQKVLDEARPGSDENQVCDDANGVADDANGVADDANGVEDDANGVEGSLGSTRSDVKTIQQDFQALAAAQTTEPKYQDGAATAAEVDQVVGATNAAISSAVATANGDIAAANQYTTHAYHDAQVAAAAGSSCNGPSAPTVQPPIQ